MLLLHSRQTNIIEKCGRKQTQLYSISILRLIKPILTFQYRLHDWITETSSLWSRGHSFFHSHLLGKQVLDFVLCSSFVWKQQYFITKIHHSSSFVPKDTCYLSLFSVGVASLLFFFLSSSFCSFGCLQIIRLNKYRLCVYVSVFLLRKDSEKGRESCALTCKYFHFMLVSLMNEKEKFVHVQWLLFEKSISNRM